MDNSLMNTEQAARILGVSVKTLHAWRWRGAGPRFIKLGSAVRYRPSDLEEFVESNERLSTSDHGKAVDQ